MKFFAGRMMTILLLIPALLALNSCGGKAEKDLVGTYEGDFANGKEVIILKKDKTYIQKITLTSGSLASSSGTWKYSPSTDNIVFDSGYLIVDDGWGNLPTDWNVPFNGVALQPVMKLFNHTRLGVLEGTVLTKTD